MAIVSLGVGIFVNLDFGREADVARRLNRYEFLFTAAPLRIEGGMGSPLNPIATSSVVKCSCMRPSAAIAAAAAVLAGLSVVTLFGQRGGAFRASRDHPAIEYSGGPVQNAISELNRKLQEGSVQLTHGGRSGYLRSVLDALDIPIESQVAVFSRTSFQADWISMQNPRAIFFADNVAVAWVRDAPVLELVAQDHRQGAIFYTLEQTPADKPRFTRNDQCLACHLSWDTLGVPGLQVISMYPLSADKNAYASGFVSDHRSYLQDRWGGWYVTGTHPEVAHMGNVEVTDVEDPDATVGQIRPVLESLEGKFDADGYPSAHSDIAALMVLEHQVHMTNLITRLGWEARRVLHRDQMASSSGGSGTADGTDFEGFIQDAAAEFVDYLLFIDEVPLGGAVGGTSGFKEQFSARGPRDRQGRSLRELDLKQRLFRYPCSYMIYTEAFDTLPALAKDAIYQRMWVVLSGQENLDAYARLSLADRQAIVEILRDTKPDLPAYFETVRQ